MALRRSPIDLNELEAKRARLWMMVGALLSTKEGMHGWNQTAKRHEVHDGSGVQSYAFLSDLEDVGDAQTLDGQDRNFYLDRTNHTGEQTADTITDFIQTVRSVRLNLLADPNASVDFGGQKIVDLANGVDNTDAATVGQVNALLSDFVTSADLDALRNQILGGVAPEFDTLIELLQEIQENDDAITGLLGLISMKPDQVNMTFGDGVATQYTLEHGMGSRDLIASVRSSGPPYDVQECDIEFTTTNTVTVYAYPAPAAEELILTLIGQNVATEI